MAAMSHELNMLRVGSMTAIQGSPLLVLPKETDEAD